jgi:hypothetical protein
VSVVALPTRTETRILEIRRDDYDRTYWHQLDVVDDRGSAVTVLIEWLYDREPGAGLYRAERSGERPVELRWDGEELAAA